MTCMYPPHHHSNLAVGSVIYLIVNKLLSLTLSRHSRHVPRAARLAGPTYTLPRLNPKLNSGLNTKKKLGVALSGVDSVTDSSLRLC